jgi:hypothetical protein
MTVLTRKREALLDQLIGLAGDPTLVERAIRELNEESGSPPTMPQIVRRILVLKQELAQSAPAAHS